MHFKKNTISVIGFVLVGVLLMEALSTEFVHHWAGQRMEALVSVMADTHERLVVNEVEIILRHLAESTKGQKFDSHLCDHFSADFQQDQQFFAVLAIGDADGNPICTADPSVKQPLPTMSDRLYYQRVKTADGLVVGEFAISKTTGKKVLHFAYPIKDDTGNFRGFVLAGIDLDWFISQDIDDQFTKAGVTIMGVDENGKLLYQYPSAEAEIGNNKMSAQLISAMLFNKVDHRFLQGYDGHRRVYAYRWMDTKDMKMGMVAAVDVSKYYPLFVIPGLMGVLVGFGLRSVMTKFKK